MKEKKENSSYDIPISSWDEVHEKDDIISNEKCSKLLEELKSKDNQIDD